MICPETNVVRERVYLLAQGLVKALRIYLVPGALKGRVDSHTQPSGYLRAYLHIITWNAGEWWHLLPTGQNSKAC